MKIIRCSYSKTFPISQYFEKIYLEAELNEGDDTRKCLYELKKQVQDFFYESNAAAEKQMGTHVELSRIELADKVGLSMEDQIESCQEMKVLESYRLLVKNNPTLEGIYLRKLKQLSHA